jgi:hypothetical protein
LINSAEICAIPVRRRHPLGSTNLFAFAQEFLYGIAIPSQDAAAKPEMDRRWEFPGIHPAVEGIAAGELQ